MADQIVYDGIGNFQGILRTNADGSQTSFGPGTNLWDDYVSKFGAPPITGAPTFPAPAPTSDQLLIASVKTTLTDAQITAQLPAIMRALAKRLR